MLPSKNLLSPNAKDPDMGQIGWPQLVIVLVIVLVIFGARRLPEVGRSLGAGMREFKDSITGKDDPTEPTITPGDDTKHV